jgi:hypothetical protein
MFDFVIAFDSLTVSPKPPLYVTGRVWLKFDTNPFPEEGWTDIPLSVLGSFKSALEDVRQSGAVDFYFFEGSFFVKLILEDQDQDDPVVRVCGVREYYSKDVGDMVGEVEHEVRVPLSLLKSVYRQRRLQFQEWAEVHGEAEVGSLLSKMADV